MKDAYYYLKMVLIFGQAAELWVVFSAINQ